MDSPVATPPADAQPGDPPGAYPLLDSLGPPRRRHFTLRILLGCLIVLAAAAGATATAVLEQVHTVVQDLGIHKHLKIAPKTLAPTYFGGPETLLLVGNDTRSVFKYYNAYVPNLANEMLLVRIDPNVGISMMSIPRELWVTYPIPGGGTYTNRLNSAYSFGATTLVNAIKQVTGIQPNHVIVTTFTQFEKAIDTLGCVYTTIDERYYHNNADGGDQYQNVDLEPGYQCLSGGAAEEFVSYRHTDSSQVRDSRDQAFLLAVKQQYGPELSLGSIGRFEKIFGETVSTDSGLDSDTEILNLANLLIDAKSLRVRQVPFQAEDCPVGVCPAGDLTATPQQIQQSVNDFLHGKLATPKAAVISHNVSKPHGHARLPLTRTLATNVQVEKSAAAKLPFTAEFPKVQDLAGSSVPIYPSCDQYVAAGELAATQSPTCIRNYLIHAPNGDAYPAYVEVFAAGGLGQYYDVQGTTWSGAPLLRDPNQTLQIGARRYELFYDSSHLATIAWRQYGAVYWVHNTLTNAVGNGEMLAIAEQTTAIGPVRSTPAHVILKTFSVPPRKAPAPRTPLIQSIGKVGGLVVLVLVPFGLLAVILGRLRLSRLRREVDATAARAAALAAQLEVASAGYRQLIGQTPAAPAPWRPFGGGPTSGGSGAVNGSQPHSAVRSSRRALTGAGVSAIVAAVGAGAYLTLGGSAQGIPRKPRPLPVPSAAVAILNAGTTRHAARRLAIELSDRHVHVIATGNLNAPAPSGYRVLFVPGELRQARELAGLLAREHPTIAPTDAAAIQAAGLSPKLVVVIP